MILRRFVFFCFSFFLFQYAQAQTDDFSQFQLRKGGDFLAPDSLFSQLKIQYEQAIEQKDLPKSIQVQRKMGTVCLDLGHLAQALDYFQNAQKTATNIQNKNLEAELSNDIGNLYFRNKLKDAAKREYDRALSLFLVTKNASGIAATYGYIGHYFEKQQSYDTALFYQNEALQQYQKSQDRVGIAHIYENLGSIYEDLAQYDKALLLFQNVVAIYDRQKQRDQAVETINNIGDIYRKTGKYDSAIHWSQMALEISMRTGNVYEQASAHKDLGETYHLLNQNDSAFYYMKMSRKELLNIYSVQNNQQTNFLNILYESEKKDQALAILEKSKKINRIFYVAIGIGVLLLIAIFLVVYFRQKFKIQQAKEESIRQEEQSRQQQLQLEQKTKELANHTIAVVQRNQFLEDLKEALATMAKDDRRDQKKQMQSLVQKINQNAQYENQWQEFNRIFEEVHPSFFQKINTLFPELSSNDIKLLALHKMKMESKEMALILGISPESLRVSRYRLRKKMGLDEGVNLSNYLQEV